MRNIQIGQIVFFSGQLGFANPVLGFLSRIFVQFINTALASSATRLVVSSLQGSCSLASSISGAVALTVSRFKKLSRSFSFGRGFWLSCSVLVLALSSVCKVRSLNGVPFSNNKAQHIPTTSWWRTRYCVARPCARRYWERELS